MVMVLYSVVVDVVVVASAAANKGRSARPIIEESCILVVCRVFVDGPGCEEYLFFQVQSNNSPALPERDCR